MKTLAEQRAEFLDEFAAIETTLTNASAQLDRLLKSYRLNDAALIDAQAHALAGLAGLRKVAEQIAPGQHARPSRLPAHKSTLSLADQLAAQRAEVAGTLALVARMPGVQARAINNAAACVATDLFKVECAVRTAER